MNIIVGASIGAVLGSLSLLFKKKEGFTKCITNCLFAHKKEGLNYVWLEEQYGKVLKIEYKEPPDTGEWLEYTDKIWKIHCKVVDHGDNLVEEHIKAFVNPKTRFAKLKFTFLKNGNIYSREPDGSFYVLEKMYFDRFGICKGEEGKEEGKGKDKRSN